MQKHSLILIGLIDLGLFHVFTLASINTINERTTVPFEVMILFKKKKMICLTNERNPYVHVFLSSFRSLWNNQQNGETNIIIVNVNTLIVQNQLSLPKCFFIIFFHNLSQCLYTYITMEYFITDSNVFFLYNFFLCFLCCAYQHMQVFIH